MFKKSLIIAIILAMFAIVTADEKKEQNMQDLNVIITTSKGDIQLELWADKSPKTVENFVNYIEDGYYNGVIFHRIINGFMIQAGGFDENENRKIPKYDPITNEADNMLSNDYGTIAMARKPNPHSAQAQFFINVNDNKFLDHKDTGKGFGYCVFGKVTKGLDVVNKIKSVETHVNPKFGMKDWPKEQILITEIKIIEE